ACRAGTRGSYQGHHPVATLQLSLSGPSSGVPHSASLLNPRQLTHVHTQAHAQTDRQTDRQTHTHTQTNTHRQTNTHTHCTGTHKIVKIINIQTHHILHTHTHTTLRLRGAYSTHTHKHSVHTHTHTHTHTHRS